MEVAAEGVGVLGPKSASMPRRARFMMARRRVVGLLCFGCCRPQPHPAGSRCETKWALPPRPFVLAVDADVAELAAVGFDEFFRLHTAMRDSAFPFREAGSAEPACRQTASGAAGGVVFIRGHVVILPEKFGH